MLLGEENVHVVNFNKNVTFLRSWNDEEQNYECCEEEDETQASSTSHKGSKEEEKEEQIPNIDNMENVDQQ